MTQTKRIFAGLALLLLISAAVLGAEYLRGRSSLPAEAAGSGLTPGNVPIYLDGELTAAFTPDSLDGLEPASFVDAAEGKEQDGWLLRDILLTYLDSDLLSPDTVITVTSSSREKSAALTWAEVEDRENKVMFDLSNRGTLKLISLLEKLDERKEWVQDADRIEVTTR